MCSACSGSYQDPDRTAPTAEDLDAVAADEWAKEATDNQGEVIARLRRHGLTPPVDWQEVERTRREFVEADEPEEPGVAIRGALTALAIEVLIALMILAVLAVWP